MEQLFRLFILVSLLISDLKCDATFDKIKNHAALKLLPENCGDSAYFESEALWLAMVLSDDKILCTGSVITNKEILLPASCALNEKAKRLLIGTCPTNIDEECIKDHMKCFPAPVINVDITNQTIYCHPKYQDKPRLNDIAIIRCNEEFKDERVRAICLPTSKSFYEKNLTEVGMNGYLLDTMPMYARKVTTIKADDVCKKKFKEHYQGDKHLCTEYSNLKLGAQMSVGVENPPLETGKVVLYGVLAHENSKRSLNIFLKTTYFLSWILDVLSGQDAIANHPSIHLFNNDKCGPFELDNRIGFGNKTNLFQYPWMALLKYKKTDGFLFKCGATLVSNKYVITAGHCVKSERNRETLVAVRVGEHDLSQEIDCFNDDETDTPEMCAEKFQELEIEEIIVHPEAKEGVSANDIALIRMKEAANFNKNVQPVCLPFSSELRKSKIREIISLGWGATEEKWYSDVLLDATMPYVTIERCRKMYEGKALVLSEERQFCAGAVEKVSTCRGDSGGGVVVLSATTSRSKFVQYGIVSAGLFECGKIAGYPDIFTRITFFIQWILDNVKD